MNHVTIGVYASGSYKVNVVKPEDLSEHIAYNKVMRFGRALFVDGTCVNPGYLDEDQVKEWEKIITQMRIDSSKPSLTYH
jgi:predicted Co/Zn/Cd cation transporter (cation efflux family)